jgi:ubiquinone/menaquinone biosynthesis C-methylase UbiE
MDALHPEIRTAVNPTASLAREYSDKADAYERCWAPVLRPMARSILGELPLAGARTVLDVGSGTGALLPDLIAAAPNAQLIAVDRADGMLRLARRVTPDVVVIDAQRLAVRSGTVDVATMAFMLFHVPQPALALREVRRVLRPRAAAGVVVWGADYGVPGLSIWTEMLDAHGAARDSRDPSVMNQGLMDTPDKLAGLLRAAGYSAVRTWSRTFEYHWRVDDLIEMQLGCGMAARRIASLSAPAAAACTADVRKRLASLNRGDLVHRPEVVFGVGFQNPEILKSSNPQILKS